MDGEEVRGGPEEGFGVLERAERIEEHHSACELKCRPQLHFDGVRTLETPVRWSC